MTTPSDDIIERWLEAVAAQLPPETRADITDELRELIVSRMEAREAELGRDLTPAEVEGVLKEIGHPLAVAARYRAGPDSLIGPELLPWWLYGVKAGLLVLLAIHALSLVVTLVSGPRDPGQAISQAFHGLFGSGLTLIGALTLAGAVMEHYRIRPKWMTEWRAKDLSLFGLSDPTTWGVKAREASKASTQGGVNIHPVRVRVGNSSPAGEAVFSILALGLFILWWLGLVSFPGLATFEIADQPVTVAGAPVWAALYAPILAFALVQMAIDLFTLINPTAERLRALLRAAVAAANLVLLWFIVQAGDLFVLTSAGQTATVAIDQAYLTLDWLRMLDERGRDLEGVALTLSILLTWSAAVMAVAFVGAILANLVRMIRGRAA
ncbi:hypothetical protein IP78_03410 [Brevundimonas sp. AAP58]|uniref:hypothetical protein n=1 Tax=Brevundimonas sp. AAP58 TaxID=1523422 RepID=UPI0006BA030F|nr:hypothetical protein [Brevundimonas sp. AAP58]KPF82920.1 hypothetical protein IP78_03410 [Brevundimonas sp. AAP58]